MADVEAIVNAIRTWTISGRRVATTADQAVRGDLRLRTVVSLPDLAEGEFVTVIEAEPVLDLLERWLDDSPYYADLTPETVALLRANGRRKASESP